MLKVRNVFCASLAAMGLALFFACTASAAFYDSSYYGEYTSDNGIDVTLNADGFEYGGATMLLDTTNTGGMTFWSSNGGGNYYYGLSDNNGRFAFVQTSTDLGFWADMITNTLSQINFDWDDIENSIGGIEAAVLPFIGLLGDSTVGLGLFSDTETRFDIIAFNPQTCVYQDTFRAAHTPIPGAVWLLGSGLVGLVGLRRKFS